MAIKLDCPRCKKPLSIPRKKIGRYVNCPRCGGRFWVPEKVTDVPGSDAVAAPSNATGAAQSALKLAEDGRLPELHLREGQQRDKKEAKTTSVNPLVLFGLLAVERYRLQNYATFPFDDALKQIAAGLDQRVPHY